MPKTQKPAEQPEEQPELPAISTAGSEQTMDGPPAEGEQLAAGEAAPDAAPLPEQRYLVLHSAVDGYVAGDLIPASALTPEQVARLLQLGAIAIEE